MQKDFMCANINNKIFIRPEVSSPPGSRVSTMAQTDTQTQKLWTSRIQETVNLSICADSFTKSKKELFKPFILIFSQGICQASHIRWCMSPIICYHPLSPVSQYQQYTLWPEFSSPPGSQISNWFPNWFPTGLPPMGN